MNLRKPHQQPSAFHPRIFGREENINEKRNEIAGRLRIIRRNLPDIQEEDWKKFKGDIQLLLEYGKGSYSQNDNKSLLIVVRGRIRQLRGKYASARTQELKKRHQSQIKKLLAIKNRIEEMIV